MSFELPIRKFFEGIGNINYSAPPGRTPAILGARNGLSIDGGNFNVLGNDVGATAAQLLSNREIPMNSFSVAFSGIGKTLATQPIFKLDAARIFNAPVWKVVNSADVEQCALRLPLDNSNVFLGNLAGAITVNSGQCVGIGDRALGNYTIPFQNVAIGHRAMGSGIGNGSQNVAVGTFAMINNTSGGLNIAMGHSALANNLTGLRNTALGQIALNKRLNATDNTAIGNSCLSESLVATNDSSQNTGVGSMCMQQQVVGTGNVGMGYQTAFNSPMTDRNVVIGALSFNNGTTIVSDNVLVGSSQIFTGAGTVGSNNVLLGAGITSTLAALTNTIVIGQGMTNNVNNVARIARADQNVILGSTASVADNGARLQVIGDITTTQPSANGQGKFLSGKIITAASVLNAAKYWEIAVDGVVVKVCIN